MKDLIINYTPTGMVPTKALTPHVPISVEEIIEDVHKAWEIGITMVHLHARNAEDGSPEYKAEVYGKILEGVRKHCPGLVCGISLSGRNFPEFEKRSEALQMKPDLASLTLSSLNFVQQASINSPTMVRDLLRAIIQHGAKPELEIFDLGMMNYANYLIKREKVEGPYYFNFIFGNIASMQAELGHMGQVISDLPKDSYYAFGGIGNSQLKTHMIAIASGAGVRVGVEDNIFYDQNKKILATNQQLLIRIHEIAAVMERKMMPAKTLGELGFYNKFRNDN